MLETQRGSEYQNYYCGNLADVPFTQNLTTLISALFPEASYVGCSCSGVAGDKVAWADCAGDVGAFGEVLSLVAGCEDAAVTAGSWSYIGTQGMLQGTFETFAAAARQAGLDQAAIVEVVAHVALNVLTNYVNNVAQTTVDFPAAPALAAH